MPRKKDSGKPILNLAGFLGDVDFSDENAAIETVDLVSSLFKNYGDIQLGKTDFVKHLRSLRTDQELIDFVKFYFHIDVPYVPVCEDHQSPGQAFCDAFYGRARTSLWWASRASFKSFGTGLLTVLDTLRYDNCETTILAGSQEQGNNVYAAAQQHILEAQLDSMFKLRRTKTTAINGSQFTVLTASPKSARGPHPQRLKLDEVDEIEEEIYAAAINQPMEKNGVPMSTLMTSTMHKPGGLMADIVDAAPRTGLNIYKWCYKEVTQKCLEPDCRNLQLSERYRGQVCPLLGDPIERIQDIPEDERGRLAPAKDYVVMDKAERITNPVKCQFYDGSCQGGLRRASGYIAVDAQREARLRVSSKRTWETENESRRPSQEDMVYDPIILGRCSKQEFEWDWALPVERAWAMVDWGFNNPTVMLIAQDRQMPGNPNRTEQFDHCITKEFYWEQRGLTWRINQIVDILVEHGIPQIYCDAENIDAIMELKAAINARRYTCLVRAVPFNKFKDILIENIRNDMEAGRLFISHSGCSELIRDLYKLHYRKNTEDVAKESDHGPDALVAGWRRFIQFNELATTTGADLRSAVTIRELANPARRPPSISAVKQPLALPPGSPVAASASPARAGSSRRKPHVPN